MIVRSRSADTFSVLWWFQRNGRNTRLEVLHLARGGFELHVVDGEGAEHVEYFADAKALMQRQQIIHDELLAQGWHRSGEWLI